MSASSRLARPSRRGRLSGFAAASAEAVVSASAFLLKLFGRQDGHVHPRHMRAEFVKSALGEPPVRRAALKTPPAARSGTITRPLPEIRAGKTKETGL